MLNEKVIPGKKLKGKEMEDFVKMGPTYLFSLQLRTCSNGQLMIFAVVDNELRR